MRLAVSNMYHHRTHEYLYIGLVPSSNEKILGTKMFEKSSDKFGP